MTSFPAVPVSRLPASGQHLIRCLRIRDLHRRARLDRTGAVVRFRWDRRWPRRVLLAIVVAVALLAWWLAPLFEDRLCTLELMGTANGTYSPCLCKEQEEMRARYPDALVSWRHGTIAGDCPSQSSAPSADQRSG
jgi:hypothetical protein